MNKRFNPFKATVPSDFTEKMIQFWMIDDDISRNSAIEYYYNEDFIQLSARISGNVAEFNPDLGYYDRVKDGLYCFENVDNDFVIPVEILTRIY